MAISLKDRLAAKKTAPVAAKAVVKKAAPAPVAEEEELEEEVEVEVPVAKKTPGRKPGVKAAPAPVVKKTAAKPAKEEETVTKGKPLFTGARTKREPRIYSAGDWLPYDEMINQLHASLKEDEEFNSITKAQLSRLFKHTEEFIITTIEQFDIRFCGIKTRRTHIEPRIYVPASALDKVATPYHTLVEGHIKVNIPFTFNKVTRHGDINDNGEFIEGRFDAKGNFTPGTWINKANDEFEPEEAVAPKKKVGKK